MSHVLITAFEPYDRWTTNASWLALVELAKNLPGEPKVTTRLYPVDFSAVREKLAEDLAAPFDYALHLGQAPGSALVQLEAIGINVGGTSKQSPEHFQPLVKQGPVAYRSALPLARWAIKLREAAVPAQVSYHAGTYLCNATLYLSHYLAEQKGLKTQAAFIHLPLSPSQVVAERQCPPSLSSATAARAVRLILEELAKNR